MRRYVVIGDVEELKESKKASKAREKHRLLHKKTTPEITSTETVSEYVVDGGEVIKLAPGYYNKNSAKKISKAKRKLYKKRKAEEDGAKQTKKSKTERDGNFYLSAPWRELRYAVLNRYGSKCQCCGRSQKEVKMHVDHIKPKSKYPELALDIDNLQVLCEDCNIGKSNLYETDWRKD